MVSILVRAICLFLHTFVVSASTISFFEMNQILHDATNGYVHLNKDSDLSFYIDQSKMAAWPNLNVSDPDLIHSLWSLNIYKLLENENAPDLVTAKKNFYLKQKFNFKTLSYSRPYIYLSDWHSLFHPPVREITEQNEVYGKQFKNTESEILKSPLLDPTFQTYLDGISANEMTAGNELTLLNNGKVSFKEKVRMVENARNFFFSVVMVQYCDESSSPIINAMIKKAQSGVDVRLMMEGAWANLILKKCVRKLRKGGVKVRLVKGFLQPKTIFTVSHTKFWIRDGEEAIIGGQNMHDFENSSNGFNQHTRDKDVLISKGPAVTDLLKEYIRIWNQEDYDASLENYKKLIEDKVLAERKQKLRGQDQYGNWLNQTDTSKIPGVCRVLVQGNRTSGNPEVITNTYVEIIKKTKFSMFVNTPTLRFKNREKKSNSSDIIREIISSSFRGVKVDLISNGGDAGWGEFGHQLRIRARNLRLQGKANLAEKIEKIETKIGTFAQRTNVKHLKSLLKNKNIDIWLYFNHIHSKQMMFDQIVTSTGSYNLDPHSYKNHESTLICIDKKLADETMKGFISDVVNSVPLLKEHLLDNM